MKVFLCEMRTIGEINVTTQLKNKPPGEGAQICPYEKVNPSKPYHNSQLINFNRYFSSTLQDFPVQQQFDQKYKVLNRDRLLGHQRGPARLNVAVPWHQETLWKKRRDFAILRTTGLRMLS